MVLTWLNHLRYTLIWHLLFLLVLWLLRNTWQAWRYLQVWEQRYQRFLTRQQRAQRRARSALSGLAHPPDCAECQAEPAQPPLAGPPPPPPWTKSAPQGRPRQIQPTWQACPYKQCRYYGWPGLGNLMANGHPNSGRPRQWYCHACRKFFTETRAPPIFVRKCAIESVS